MRHWFGSGKLLLTLASTVILVPSPDGHIFLSLDPGSRATFYCVTLDPNRPIYHVPTLSP
jgi:hypothetical protein